MSATNPMILDNGDTEAQAEGDTKVKVEDQVGPDYEDASTRARGYQLEMLRKSLQQNIVVAVTSVNMEGPLHKICWFLVPGVELGRQQCAEIRKYYHVGNIQFLSGSDGPDKWSTQDIWDEILGLKDEGPSIIVSTYQVLLDALCHGFVSMFDLSLLVFDEAHHCVRSDPSRRIMRDFYHPLLQEGKKDQLPHILGLTASPIVRSSPDQLRELEANLDAKALAPSETKEELERHMHPPIIKRVEYESMYDQDYEYVGVPPASNSRNDIQTVAVASQSNSTPPQPPPVGGGWAAHLDPRKLNGIGSKWLNLPRAYDLDESQFERIDPETGLPVETTVEKSPVFEMPPEMMVYEMIDPTTGDPYTLEALAERAAKKAQRAMKPLNSTPLKRPVAKESFWKSNGLASPCKKPRSNRVSETFESLTEVYRMLDISSDPYVLQLFARFHELPEADDYMGERKRIRQQIETIYDREDTYCQKNMRTFVMRTTHILHEYGVWGVEWFIKEAIQKYMKAMEDEENPDDVDMQAERDILEPIYWGESEEKRYIRNILRRVKVTQNIERVEDEGQLTPKVEKLINVLVEEYEQADVNPATGKKNFTGLVFVEQRVGVRVLAEILTNHPRTKKFLQVATMVGEATSNYARAAKSLYDLVIKQNQTLGDFKSGAKNLVISTSVLEEGIDVPSCNLVVCFELPKNVKSYVQRRGRARSSRSTYVLMIGSDKNTADMQKFAELEKAMVQLYEDEKRTMIKIENQTNEEEELLTKLYRFQVPGGTALLNLENATPKLHHFCALSTKSKYINLKPEFIVEANDPPALTNTNRNQFLPVFSATVILPSSLAPEVRQARSTRRWQTEKLAKRHAAYVACMQLWNAGLLNKNLMPLSTGDPEVDEFQDIAKRASNALVDVTMNPWTNVSSRWWSGDIFVTPLTVNMPDGQTINVQMFLPYDCPPVDEITLYWTNANPARAKVGKSKRLKNDKVVEVMQRVRDMSHQFIWTAFHNRMREEDPKDHPYYFLPEGFENWNPNPVMQSGMVDEKPALEAFKSNDDPAEMGIIRDHNENRYIFRRWRTDMTPADLGAEVLEKRYPNKEIIPDQPLIEAVKCPKRRDFLHKDKNFGTVEFVGDELVLAEKVAFLVPQYCTISQFPWRYTQLALFLPCIIHRVEISLIALTLQKTVLAPINLKKTSNIVTAICASSALEATNYQRFEFLGDCVLKFSTAVQLMDEKPNWHEGYLSGKKDQLVNNARLSKEATELGLGKFIVTKIFTGSKWKPVSLREEENETERKVFEGTSADEREVGRLEKQREREEKASGLKIGEGERALSTKILADVVESLLGASYLEGGYDKAVEFIKLFGGGIPWLPVETRLNSLYQRAVAVQRKNPRVPHHLRDLEKLIDYEFKNKTLLFEAILHPSWQAEVHSSLMNYQRLEFLGDAVLDMIVVNYVFHSTVREFSHVDMHLLKTAVVNADFLAFLSLELGMEVDERKVVDQRVIAVKGRRAFWEYLRHEHPDIPLAQKRVVESWALLREPIKAALDGARGYPWTLLLSMGADKFFSDIVESVLGAVFIDSRGSFDAVEKVAAIMGILPALQRLVQDDVDVSHPRKKLGEMIAEGQGELDYEVDEPVKAGGSYTCRVKVNGNLITTVEGMGTLHAKAKGADEAYSILVGMGWRDSKEEERAEMEKKRRERRRAEKKKKRNDSTAIDSAAV
ncbi:Dicer-like protein 2 [Rhizina undulata]